MYNEARMQLIQSRIEEATKQWCMELPKFRAFEGRSQALQSQVLKLDGDSFGVFHFYVELASLSTLWTCCDAYEQGQQRWDSLIERRRMTEPESGSSSLFLALRKIQPELLRGRSQTEQTLFRAWESYWLERERLLIGAAKVWGFRSSGPLIGLCGSYAEDELDTLLAPYRL